jgi:hypothetical protein
MNQEFERSEAARKSIRLRTKRMAPAPPNQAKTTTEIEMTNEKEDVQKMSPSMESRNTTRFINSTTQHLPKIEHFEKIILDNAAKTKKSINIRNNYTLRLSDLKCDPAPTSRAGTHLDSSLSKEGDKADGNDDASKTALDELERRIHLIENHTKINSAGEEVKKPVEENNKYSKAIRYGEMENLLKGGVSHITSRGGLGYLEKGDSEIEIENPTNNFKRGVDGRSSVSGTSKIFSKAVRPANRTASDTNNAENTIKLMRSVLRKQEQSSEANKIQINDVRIISDQIKSNKITSSPKTRQRIITPNNYQNPIQVKI